MMSVMTTDGTEVRGARSSARPREFPPVLIRSWCGPYGRLRFPYGPVSRRLRQRPDQGEGARDGAEYTAPEGRVRWCGLERVDPHNVMRCGGEDALQCSTLNVGETGSNIVCPLLVPVILQVVCGVLRVPGLNFGQ